MTMQSALLFIAAVREDPELVRKVQELKTGTTVDRLVTLGASRGFDFTAAELRSAYKADWAIRMARYGANRPGGSAS